MENSSVASASSEAGSSRSQKIEELERFIDSYVLEYQVQGLLMDKMEGDGESEKTQSHISQWTVDCSDQFDGSCSLSQGKGSSSHEQSQRKRQPEIITRSLSLGELCDLQMEFTHQTNESILTWLLCIWNAAANDTILDGSEARKLGSLSRHVVIDQGIGTTQETLSLWQRLLTGVKDRYFCKEELQVHQGKWSTVEQGGSQLLTVLEAKVSLTGNKWQKHPIVTSSEASCILGIEYLRNGYLKDLKGYHWAFGISAVETEDIRKLNTLPGLSDDPSAVGLPRVEEQQVPIATATVHRWQYRTDRDSVIAIYEMIRKLESQGVVSKACSPFNSPIWPVCKSGREWRLTVDYRGLNEVTLPLSAAVPGMLQLQYGLESKAAKWYATIDIANAFFSIPLAAEYRPQFAFTWRGVQQYTWNQLPQGWKHSPTICMD
ncbi:hypothetical protein TURU_111412 [Turdus rufiventris]|nr:hypothetical protein TURU_111412 [Turdus rufiventris]